MRNGASAAIRAAPGAGRDDEIIRIRACLFAAHSAALAGRPVRGLRAAWRGAGGNRRLALDANSYIVKADEGYGVNDCIRGGDDCAKVVADAWCEAHGHGEAKAFGRARDNITGSIVKTAASSSAPPRISADNVFISCKD